MILVSSDAAFYPQYSFPLFQKFLFVDMSLITLKVPLGRYLTPFPFPRSIQRSATFITLALCSLLLSPKGLPSTKSLAIRSSAST